MSLTTDPNDPRLTRGVDSKPTPQAPVYLILSEEERAKGFVRPLRRAYRHVGQKPANPLRPLTDDEVERYKPFGYVKYEAYPPAPDGQLSVVGRFWTQAELDKKPCGMVTTMGLALCETYARQPTFYGSTYCTGCAMHLPVAEFVWIESNGNDGEIVGS